MNNQTTSEIFHQVFQYTSGRPFIEIYENADPFESADEENIKAGGLKDVEGNLVKWHPSIPQNEAVIVAYHDYQGFLFRYPDNTYHHLDIGGYWTDETTGQKYYYPIAVDEDSDTFLTFLREVLDEGLFWAYGLIVGDNETVTEKIEAGEFKHILETLPKEE